MERKLFLDPLVVTILGFYGDARKKKMNSEIAFASIVTLVALDLIKKNGNGTIKPGEIKAFLDECGESLSNVNAAENVKNLTALVIKYTEAKDGIQK